jgi:hypothetical protein
MPVPPSGGSTSSVVMLVVGVRGPTRPLTQGSTLPPWWLRTCSRKPSLVGARTGMTRKSCRSETHRTGAENIDSGRVFRAADRRLRGVRSTPLLSVTTFFVVHDGRWPVQFAPRQRVPNAAITVWPGEDEPRLPVQVALNIRDLDPHRTVRPYQPTVQQQSHRGAVRSLLKLGQVAFRWNSDGSSVSRLCGSPSSSSRAIRYIRGGPQQVGSRRRAGG